MPLGVHVGEAGVAEVGEFGALDGLRPEEVGAGEAAAGDRVGGDAGDDAGYGEVFFQGDDAHAWGSSRWVGGKVAWRRRGRYALSGDGAQARAPECGRDACWPSRSETAGAFSPSSGIAGTPVIARRAATKQSPA